MAVVASMTGFAVANRETSMGVVTVDVRSVNARFLDLTLRVGDELRSFEQAIREAIAQRLARGKVDCRVVLQRHATAQAPRINATALAQLAQLAREVRAALPEAAPLAVGEVLAWHGVVESAAADTEELRGAVLGAVSEALDSLQASRTREGAALAAALLARCDGIDAIVEQLRPRVPELLAAMERKLLERLNQTLAPALAANATLTREEIADRIRQEVTLYGLRADVDEELKRLATHVAEVRRVLAAGGAVGRRLDFLMQELNREANTLGSKASAIEMTNAAVELKILIEQMREQIQNLE
ncbi:MAG: YicC family protein [Burkholderiaceae bacterium]|nr:YicC family protein [Burkholderiaceae bacterium]